MENEINSIEVIGSGCVNCKKLHEAAVLAAKELGIGVEVKYSDDIQKGLAMGLMRFPIMTINGKAVITGKADIEQIKAALRQHKGNDNQAGCCPCGGDCGCL